jgi:hypothetical protein
MATNHFGPVQERGWVDQVEQVDTLSYGYRILRLETHISIQKEVYQVYPLYPEGSERSPHHGESGQRRS